MDSARVEENLIELTKEINEDSFIYDLLIAYGQPKSTITRLKKGSLNLSKNNDEIIWKKKLNQILKILFYQKNLMKKLKLLKILVWISFFIQI